MNNRHHAPSDLELMLAVERAKRPNRERAGRRNGWERELWNAYVLDGPGRMTPAANVRPADSA
jgi:hypothetical protein